MVLRGFRKVFAILVCLSFLTASLPAQAQTKTSTVGQFKVVKKGDPAPFDGVFYDLLGNAVILTDKEQAEKKHQLELKEQKERLQADHKRDVDNLNLRLDTSQKIFDATIAAKDKEIKETREIAINGSDGTIWWTIGGVAFGVAVGAAVVGVIALTK